MYVLYYYTLICADDLSIYRLERKMKEIESVHGIQIRWTEDSSEYQSFEHARITRKKQQLLDKLGVCARERWYMLNVKAKFAGNSYALWQPGGVDLPYFRIMQRATTWHLVFPKLSPRNQRS